MGSKVRELKVLGRGKSDRKAKRRPDLVDEKALWRSGHRMVAGVDEVGRGAWAGPVSVGVAVLHVAGGHGRLPEDLRDSKCLSEARREALYEELCRWPVAWAVGHAGPEECDEHGMTRALGLAAVRALNGLPPEAAPDVVLLDGPYDYVTPALSHWGQSHQDQPSEDQRSSLPVHPVIGGDSACASVSAASVLAKVTRDRLLRELASSFPSFAFDRNKGYPSPAHQLALRINGLTTIHRQSWVFAQRFESPQVETPGTPAGDG
jgi:ribonuclease HII